MQTNAPACVAFLIALCVAIGNPALAQSQATRTGTGGVAGQEFPTQQPVATGVILAGAAAAAVLGAVLAMHASKDTGAAAGALTTVTTTTR